jgi:hypothetical protein
MQIGKEIPTAEGRRTRKNTEQPIIGDTIDAERLMGYRSPQLNYANSPLNRQEWKIR